MNENGRHPSPHQRARRYVGRWVVGMLMGVVSLTACSNAGNVQELKETFPNRITHELVMQLDVKLGPTEDMGQSADGHRINYPIIGGTFIGKDGLSGTIVPGGADFSLRHSDGVDLVEALYRIKTDDGQIIIVHNAGIFRVNAAGLERQAKGEPPEPGDIYARTIPSFKTQPGAYSWLSDYIFVGTIDPVGEDDVLISIYKIDGV